jgi:hypothetical protein
VCGPLARVGQRCKITNGGSAVFVGHVVSVGGQLDCEHPQATQPPAATGPTVSGNCTMGWERATNSSPSGLFIQGQPAVTVSDYVLAYQLALTSTGQATADVNGFAVTFYNSAGSETGSDQQSYLTPTFITQGQTLYWTVVSSNTSQGYGVSTSGLTTSGLSPDAATCSLVQWYHP